MRLETSMTPAAKWGPLLQGALVVAALAVLFAAILHNGWFADIHRRLSELANRGRPEAEDTEDDPTGDDEVADSELDEDSSGTARPGPEEGDL